MQGFVWEKHIQDLRKEQLHNQEIGGDGGNGGGREGRDGGGRSDSNGGQEDQNSLDETIQVVLATLSFILAVRTCFLLKFEFNIFLCYTHYVTF